MIAIGGTLVASGLTLVSGVIALLGVALIVAGVVWFVLGPQLYQPPTVRFTVTAPPGVAIPPFSATVTQLPEGVSDITLEFDENWGTAIPNQGARCVRHVEREGA